MRLLLPVIIALAIGCGTTPEPDASNSINDSSMNNDVITSSDNTVTDAEKKDGWELLFDGKTLAGWHSYLNQDGGGWQVVDGMIFLDKGVNGPSLVTDSEYSDFHLKADWKISEGGNSGIMFAVKEEPQFERDYHTGPEMQVLDNASHPDAKIIKHRAGDLYDLISSSPETVKPAGEWNTAEIVVKDSTLEFILNGSTVVRTTLWDDAWKKLVEGSKFKAWPSFGTFQTGRITLQDHSDRVWYKNIKLRKL